MLARRHAEDAAEMQTLIENSGQGADLLFAGAQLQLMFPIDGEPLPGLSFWSAAESFLEYRAEIEHQRDNPSWSDR
jgi:hypothetical protein